MTNQSTHPPASARRLLPVTTVAGMPIVDVTHGSIGVVAGITQEYCIYRLADGDSLCVARWRDVALGNVCPAEPLLPPDIAENDRLNASATVLRELLALANVSPLTPAQTSVLEELVALLCPG